MSIEVDFVKLQGAGNEFILIEDLDSALEIAPSRIAALCDRQGGIGADGIVLIRAPRDPICEASMAYWSSNGTDRQLRGNALLCVSKYLVDYGFADERPPLLTVETPEGVKTISYTTDDQGFLATATVNMGSPDLNPQHVPTNLAFNAMTEWGEAFVRESPLASPFGLYEFTCMSMVHPHAVAFVDDCDAVDLDTVGAYFESCDAFPEKANIELATATPEGVRMRIFERGCGEALACGTGACAAGIAAYLTGRSDARTNVVFPGGTLDISYTPGQNVLMTGSVTFVCRDVVALD